MHINRTYKLSRTILVIFFILLVLPAVSQPKVVQDIYARFSHLTTEDGLPSNRITAIFQDKDRFVWIGTGNGLSRYDGHELKNFFHSENDTTSIPGNYITCITQDSTGAIWVGTKQGLASLSAQTNEFVTVPLIMKAGKGLSNEHVRAILPDSLPYLWVETVDGNLHRLNTKTYFSQIFPHKRIRQPYYDYHTIVKDSYDKLWIGGRNLGPVWFNAQTKKFIYIPADAPELKKKRDNDVAAYFEDSRSMFYISGTDGFYIYDRIRNIFKKKLKTSTFGISEDKNGMLWLATAGGLYKYDVKKDAMTRYAHNESDPYSISADHQYCLLADADGNIWTGTRAGVNILYKERGACKHYRHIPFVNGSLDNNKISSFMQLDDSTLFVGTMGGGLNEQNLKTELFHAYTKDKNQTCAISSNKVSTIKKGNDCLWVGLWQGVGFNRFDLKTKCFKRYAVSPNTFKVDWYNDFLDTGSDTLWCGIWGGLGIHFFDKETGKFLKKNYQPSDHPDNHPLKFQIINNNFMLSFFHGIIYVYDTITNQFKGYTPEQDRQKAKLYNLIPADLPRGNKTVFDGINSGDKTFLATQKGIVTYDCRKVSFETFGGIKYPVYAITNSSVQNAFWIATDKGLEYFDYQSNKNYIVERSNRLKSPLHGRKILSLLWLSKDRLLIGSDKGLLIYNPSLSDFSPLKNELKNTSLSEEEIKKIFLMPGKKIYFILTQGFAHSSTKLENIKIYSVANSFSHKMPTDIIFGITPGFENGTVYLSTDIGVILFNEDKQSFSAIQKTQRYTIFSSKVLGKKLSLCTNKGYLQYLPEADSIIHHNFPAPDRLSSHLITFLRKDRNGFVWAGSTDRGVNRINPATGIIDHYFEGNHKGFRGKDALCFLQTSTGDIYIGGEKLNLFDSQNNCFKRPAFYGKLPEDPVLSMLEDDNKDIWIVTENNIFRAYPETGSITDIGKLTGLKNISFTKGILKLLTGEILIGSEQGYFRFDPDKLFDPKAHKVTITGIKVMGKDKNILHNEANGLLLNYDENFFSINFSAMDFSPIEKTYKYKLEGVDETWRLTSDHSASYTKLPPGNYLFRVKEAGRPKTLTSYKINIRPPFYKTWRFISLIVLIIATGIIYWWTQRLKKLNIEKNNIRLRQRLLLSQLNPHFMFNALVAIQNFIYQNKPRESGKYLAKFAKLMRLYLENMRSEHTTVDKEVATLTYYLEMQKLRFDDSFEFNITTNGFSNTSSVEVPTMMIQPLVENAIEHGLKNTKGGMLKVSFKQNKKTVTVTIEDNGKGYAPDREKTTGKKHRSVSTSILKERIDNLNREHKTKDFSLRIVNLSDLNTGRTGTQVTIVLPLLFTNKNDKLKTEDR